MVASTSAATTGTCMSWGRTARRNCPARTSNWAESAVLLTSARADAKYDWFTNYGNLANTNANDQDVKPPFKLKWVNRYEGTFKHIPICGGGRMYTHTAEGQIFALEQETGRLLWRRYWPDVHLSFTSPIYCRRGGKELLLVPQGGIKRSSVRCLDAATGELLWEAPFTGSPSWSRQGPPVIFENLAIYGFGSGKYAPQGTEPAYVFRAKPEPAPDGAEIMAWMYTHDNPYYPQDNKPFLRAWDLDTGKVVWEKDFSEFGRGGNDVGLCLMDGTLYYSTFFGYAAKAKDGTPKSQGFTAAIEPATGRVHLADDTILRDRGLHPVGRKRALVSGRVQHSQRRYEDPSRVVPQRERRVLDLAIRAGGEGGQRGHGRREIPLRPRFERLSRAI